MLLMQLGEIIFGGIGCGLYSMIGFVILTVFIAGLMVGRTPEYLGKKIGPKEMRMAGVLAICTPVVILVGAAAMCLDPATFASQRGSARLFRSALCGHVGGRQQWLGLRGHELQHAVSQHGARLRDAG